MSKPTYFVDDRIVPRIKQILRARRGRTNVSSLTEELQMQYGECARKNALVKSVEKGLQGLTIAMKELQKEGIIISTNSSSSSDSETDHEADQHKDTNILNSMINSMYMQGRPATATSVNKVTSSTHTPSVSSSVDSQKRASRLSGAQAESVDLRGRESRQSLCINRRSNTNTPAEEMELDVSHNNSIHLATASNDMDLIDGDGSSDKTKDNVDSATSRWLRKRRRESPDGLKKKKQKQPVHPNVNFSNVGGNDSILQDLLDNCCFLENPLFLLTLKGYMRSFLFIGPSGYGKTLTANAIAGEYKVPLLSVSAAELDGGISGDSQANIRDLFNQAAELAPCVLLIDDIDAITTTSESAAIGVERRFIMQLCSSMADLRSKNLPVLMICATSKPNSLDASFRIHIDIEYVFTYPKSDARKSILETLCQGVQLAEDVSLSEIANLTGGYAGSDLNLLVATAGSVALNRVSEYRMHRQNYGIDCEKTDKGIRRQKCGDTTEEVNRISPPLTMSDFLEQLTEVWPFRTVGLSFLVPVVSWNDVVGLDSIRKKLDLREKHKELYQAYGRTPVKMLLVGPPGCGKKLAARATAKDAGLDFMYVEGTKINIKELFEIIGNLVSCVVFFENIDSICPNRSSGSREGSASHFAEQLLWELSRLEKKHVYFIATTIGLDRLDPALLDLFSWSRILNVGLPSPEERVEILKAIIKSKKSKFANDVDLDTIGKDIRCDGFSGADLEKLLGVAKEACLENIVATTEMDQPSEMPVINKSHIETAFKKITS